MNTFSKQIGSHLATVLREMIQVDEAVKQTSCRHCQQDIENFHPYRKGEWRDRGNNTKCPNDSGKTHAPYIEKPQPMKVKEAMVPKKRELSVPEKHQLRVARQTLRYTDAGANVMGGPNKEQAREIIFRLTGKRPTE